MNLHDLNLPENYQKYTPSYSSLLIEASKDLRSKNLSNISSVVQLPNVRIGFKGNSALQVSGMHKAKNPSFDSNLSLSLINSVHDPTLLMINESRMSLEKYKYQWKQSR
jgi:hypothetical protein